jgi:hypothetical protein
VTSLVPNSVRAALELDRRQVHDPDVHLLLPKNDVVEPEFSIVIPALNEQLTIADFVSWCHEGMRKADVVGEIVIVDSGTDQTT